MFSGIRTDNTRPLGFFFKAEPVSSKLRTHVQKELDRGAESHSQLQIFPFLCATLYMKDLSWAFYALVPYSYILGTTFETEYSHNKESRNLIFYCDQKS
jgi:hypothetical protein